MDNLLENEFERAHVNMMSLGLRVTSVSPVAATGEAAGRVGAGSVGSATCQPPHTLVDVDVAARTLISACRRAACH